MTFYLCTECAKSFAAHAEEVSRVTHELAVEEQCESCERLVRAIVVIVYRIARRAA
jgi:bacterioferritin-associated ferredoxin